MRPKVIPKTLSPHVQVGKPRDSEDEMMIVSSVMVNSFCDHDSGDGVGHADIKGWSSTG